MHRSRRVRFVKRRFRPQRRGARPAPASFRSRLYVVSGFSRTGKVRLTSLRQGYGGPPKLSEGGRRTRRAALLDLPPFLDLFPAVEPAFDFLLEPTVFGFVISAPLECGRQARHVGDGVGLVVRV